MVQVIVKGLRSMPTFDVVGAGNAALQQAAVSATICAMAYAHIRKGELKHEFQYLSEGLREA